MNKEEYLNEAEKDWSLPITENMFQSDKIKLIKGQRGGYGWEISMLSLDVVKLKQKNDEMLMAFGTIENNKYCGTKGEADND